MVRRDGGWYAKRSQIRGLAFGENELWRERRQGRGGRRGRRGWRWYAERTQFQGFPFRENQLRSVHRSDWPEFVSELP